LVGFAFFPVIVSLFLLGFGFTVQAMVQKHRESTPELIKSSSGFKACVERLDRQVLNKIKEVTLG